MSIVFQSDLDQSCSISEQEVHVLELRMKVDPRVNVNETFMMTRHQRISESLHWSKKRLSRKNKEVAWSSSVARYFVCLFGF